MSKHRIVMLGVIALGAGILGMGILRPSPAASAGMPLASTMLTGNTRAADGGALEGVAVSARLVNGTITTSVYTDEQGNYFFPALPGGKYRVWAQAVGYEAGRVELNLSPTREARQDFSLKTTKDFTKQLSGVEWVAALPEDTTENLRLKQIFNHTCVHCHPGSFVLQNRFDEAGWRVILNRMEKIREVYEGASRAPYPIIQHYKEELIPYLAKMRGPGPSPMKLSPYPRPTGDAARVVVTEYSVPIASSPEGELVGQDGSDWSQGCPSSYGARGVHSLAIDLDGNAWITTPEVNRYRSYAKVDAETGKVTTFRIPRPNGIALGTHGIQADQSRMIWLEVADDRPASELRTLGRHDPKTGEFQLLPSPTGAGKVFNSVDVDAKGKVWTPARDRPGAYAYDPATGKFTFFEAPTHSIGGYGIAGDADGNGWFGHPNLDIIGFVDYKTGKVSEIQLAPLPDMIKISTAEDLKFYEQAQSGSNMGLLPAQGPRRMGHYGNYVWWPNYWGGSISRVDIRTHEVSYYPLPIPYSSAYMTAVDKNGNVWLALTGNDQVPKFDPNTQQWTVYKLPSLGSEIRSITVNNHKDPVEVWVASNRTSKIARLQFRTEQELATVKAKLK